MKHNHPIGILLSSGMYVAESDGEVLNFTHHRDEAKQFRSISHAMRWCAANEDIDELGAGRGVYTVLLSEKTGA